MRNNSPEKFKGENIRSKRRDKQKGRRLQERYLFRAEPGTQEIKGPERKKVEDLIDEAVKDYNAGGLENQEVFNITGELRKKMIEQGYNESQCDEAVEQLVRKLNWEIGEDGRIKKTAETTKTAGGNMAGGAELEVDETLKKKSDFELPRKATEITLARIDNYQELWAETEEEGNKKFIEKTKELWKEFVVHGVMGMEKKTGKKVIINYSDLDGKCSLELLKLAGINTKNVTYVAPGKFISGKINLDTGGRHGLVIEDEGETVFMDHHTDKSGKDASATKIVYEVLTSLELLKKEKHLDKLVEFVTQVDNKSYPDEEKYFNNSHRTMLGLQRFIHINRLINYFKAGRDPIEILSDDDLKKFGFKKKSEEQKAVVESSLAELKKMESDGFIIPSERYGNIAIDIDNHVKAGFDAAKAYGCGAYIIWNPKENSFFISVKDKLSDNFSQGKKIRGTMWIKPIHDNSPLSATLKEILEKMTDSKFQPVDKLKEFIEKEATGAAAMGGEKKISHQEAQLGRVEMADKEINKYFIQGTMEPKKSLKEMESERVAKAQEEINNTMSDIEMYEREKLTEELKDRYLALWGERSKILGGNMPDRTERFRDVEKKIGELDKQFAKLGIKIELFKWIGEKGEEAKRVAGEEKEEEIKEKPVAEEVKAEKTAEQILKEMGVKINIEDIEGEIKCEIKDEIVKIEFENKQAVEELLDKLNFNASEKEILKNNIGITLNGALDAEAEREFSRLWKHHKKVLVAGFAASALAGICSAGARMLGGGMAMKAGKIAGGVIFGAGAGVLRGKIREWMNPAIEKIKKNNAEKLADIRQEKSKELFNENNLKTVTVQEIRRALLNKFAKGEENIFDSKNNALEFVKNNKELSKLQPEEREELANGIAVLAGIMNENSKRLGELLESKHKKGMSEIKRSALLGATIGGSIGVAQSIADSPYMPAIAAGAIGGIMAGRAIDIAWAKKEIEKKTEKIIKEIETMDLAEEGISDELSKLKSYLESGILDKYPLIREKAKRMLIDELIKPAKKINEVEVDNQIKRLEKEFTRSKTKKILSYAAGIGGSMAIGAAGRFIFEQAHDLIKPESSAVDKEFLKELENLPKADKEYIAEHGLEKFMSEKYLKDKLPFEMPEHVEEPETAGVKGMISEQFAEVKIKGKTDTFSEAIYEAAKKSDAKTQENFIHKVLGDKVKVEDGNKSELLSRAVRKLSIANLEKVDSNVQNRLYEGNIVRLKSDGSWEELKGEGTKGPSAVKEDVLRGYAEKTHAVEAVRGAAESEEHIKHIDLSETFGSEEKHIDLSELAKESEFGAAKGAPEEIARAMERIKEHGFNDEMAQKLKINPQDGFSEDEINKLSHLASHENNLEQAAESIKMVEGSGVSYDDAYEYFYQLKNLSGEPGRMEGIVEILKHHDYKSGLSKIFGITITEKNFEVKGGVYRIKDFKQGFDYIVKIDGGEITFGVDGPLGQWNWGARGRTWRAYADADLTNENIEKAKGEVENMLNIFKKRR